MFIVQGKGNKVNYSLKMKKKTKVPQRKNKIHRKLSGKRKR